MAERVGIPCCPSFQAWAELVVVGGVAAADDYVAEDRCNESCVPAYIRAVREAVDYFDGLDFGYDEEPRESRQIPIGFVRLGRPRAVRVVVAARL